MYNFRKYVSLLLTAAMLFALAGCNVTTTKAGGTIGDKTTLAASPSDTTEDRLRLDINRSLAIAEVLEVSGGPGRLGRATLDPQGMPCQELKCRVLHFYNEARLKEQCGKDDAYCRYNNYTYFENVGQLIMDEKFYAKAEEIGRPVVYKIYLDGEYRDTVKVGDTILVNLETLLDQNTNKEATSPRNHHLVIAPFSLEHKTPVLAKFADGKLQLGEELKDSLNLKRLYEDTEPGRTAIKDGDSIEDVISFIKCVEQDVERYKAENPQDSVDVVRPELAVEGTDLICKAGVNAPGKKIEAKLELFGTADKLVANWSASGEGSVAFEEKLPVEYSVHYMLKISGTADGEPFAYAAASGIYSAPK